MRGQAIRFASDLVGMETGGKEDAGEAHEQR